jgi:DNA-binding transcriptional regulator YiaG
MHQSEPTRTRLIADLEAERERLGLTHQAFARHLRVNEATWSCVRRGLQRPSPRLLLGVIGRFPELTDDAIALAHAA